MNDNVVFPTFATRCAVWDGMKGARTHRFERRSSGLVHEDQGPASDDGQIILPSMPLLMEMTFGHEILVAHHSRLDESGPQNKPPDSPSFTGENDSTS